MTLRRYLFLAAMVICSSVGDVCLSHGMKHIGAVALGDLARLLSAVLNAWVVLGILFLLGYFAAYSTALSWADLTYVQPSTAISYVTVALLSQFFLHEHVTTTRWIGILLVTCGVGIVAGGPSFTKRHHPDRDLGLELAQAANGSKPR